MSLRYMRIAKDGKYRNPSIESFIERIRKARALGCNLSYLGDDSRICKKVFADRMVLVNK